MPSSSPKLIKRFALAFNKERERTGLTMMQIAEQAGLSYHTVKNYGQGKRVPSPATAKALGEIFDSYKIVRAARAQTHCITCGKNFTFSAQYPTKYCSDRCRNYHNRNNVRQSEFQRRGDEIEIYHEAVARFCNACVQNDPICPDATCPLRPVSPIPLEDTRSANRNAQNRITPRAANRAYGSGGLKLISSLSGAVTTGVEPG